MSSSIALSSSLEDYLEAIYWLVQENRVARVKDIAETLKVSMPSVTGALRNLAGKGLVNYDPYQYITLTDEGEKIARSLARNHEILRDFLLRVLHLSPEEAEKNACRMEHAVDDEALARFVEFLEFVETCPRGGSQWLEGFGFQCQRSEDKQSCERCLEQQLNQVRQKG